MLSVYVICHRGNDSQIAVEALQKQFGETGARFRDIIGGLDAWSREVDEHFPRY